MSEVIERFEHAGYRIAIGIDPEPESPREWDNIGTMLCCHNRYKLGDKQANGMDKMYELLRETLHTLYNDVNDDSLTAELTDGKSADLIALMEKWAVVLPLYLYDHSGQRISTTPFSCEWDSGKVGLIYCPLHKGLSELYPADVQVSNEDLRERIKLTLINEVETYDQYLSGQVYYYTISEPVTWLRAGTGEPKIELEEVDSCYGYYGLDDVRAQAKSQAESLAEFARLNSAEAIAADIVNKLS